MKSYEPGVAGAELKFGRIALRRDARQVLLDGKPAPVGGRAFDLLARLLATPDDVVTKAQLMDAVWPGLAVVENNLSAQVKALRQALGDTAILTIPGRGYRLGPLAPGGEVVPEKANDRASIAVLPFDNMSGDPKQAYFVDGIAEEILTALAAFKQLQVIARNSSFVFKNQPTDVREIGRRLGVRYVLEGSVRRAADRVSRFPRLRRSDASRPDPARPAEDRTLAGVAGIMRPVVASEAKPSRRS